jgi:hypothetical protein
LFDNLNSKQIMTFTFFCIYCLLKLFNIFIFSIKPTIIIMLSNKHKVHIPYLNVFNCPNLYYLYMICIYKLLLQYILFVYVLHIYSIAPLKYFQWDTLSCFFKTKHMHIIYLFLPIYNMCRYLICFIYIPTYQTLHNI